jgi:hypothetical protein
VSAIARTIDGYLAETVGAVGARRLIPTHWDDFTQPLDERLTPMPLAVRLDRFFDDIARAADLWCRVTTNRRDLLQKSSGPKGIRTPATDVRGRRPNH